MTHSLDEGVQSGRGQRVYRNGTFNASAVEGTISEGFHRFLLVSPAVCILFLQMLCGFRLLLMVSLVSVDSRIFLFEFHMFTWLRVVPLVSVGFR